MNFTAEETWRGGHYEIEIELGAPSDERLRTALQRVWAHPSLKGCVFSRDQEPQAQVRVTPGQHALEGHLYGMATLPNGATAACGTYVCRLQGDAKEAARDLLSFYVPMGALAKAHGVSSEWLKGQRPERGVLNVENAEAGKPAEWRGELDRWMVELGRRVFESVEFELALVGWEVDFPRVSAELVRTSGVPTERYDGYLWRNGNELEWHPPTNFETVRFPGTRKREQTA